MTDDLGAIRERLEALCRFLGVPARLEPDPKKIAEFDKRWRERLEAEAQAKVEERMALGKTDEMDDEDLEEHNQGWMR